MRKIMAVAAAMLPTAAQKLLRQFDELTGNSLNATKNASSEPEYGGGGESHKESKKKKSWKEFFDKDS